jgi:hypothetical protein
MLGRINAIISGRRGIIPTPDWKYGCVWPTSKTPITLTSRLLVDTPTHPGR